MTIPNIPMNIPLEPTKTEEGPFPLVHNCIVGKLKSVWPDRVQYKPYSYNLAFENVYVAIPIQDAWKVHLAGQIYPEKAVVLTMEGMFSMLVEITEGIEEKHNASIKRKAYNI